MLLFTQPALKSPSHCPVLIFPIDEHKKVPVISTLVQTLTPSTKSSHYLTTYSADFLHRHLRYLLVHIRALPSLLRIYSNFRVYRNVFHHLRL